MKKSYVIPFLFLVFFINKATYAQVVTNEYPPSFTQQINKNLNHVPNIQIPVPDLQSIEQEDLIEDAIKDIPWRFGIEHKTNIDFFQASSRLDHSNGTSSLFLTLSGKNAKSLNLNFDHFKLSTNAKLFVYNADLSDVLGALTQKNNSTNEEFAIRPMRGSSITLEFVCPTAEIYQNKINISGIVYGYRSIHKKTQKSFGSSGGCNVNINCPEGDHWQDIKRSVVIILRSNNTRWCSGALINNVRQDSIPYILTAGHCGLQSNSIFIFNYESPTCAFGVDGSLNKSMTGATLVANYTVSDFALFRLNNKPPASYEVFYAGWDASNSPPIESVGIHHPDGDVMKISIDYEPAVSSSYSGNTSNTHWEVTDWDVGTTEQGSSGSSLFNEYQQIVGQLQGGSASCGSDLEDFYGKFSISWNTSPNSANQLKYWLDPDTTGILKMNGLDTKAKPYNIDLGLTRFIGSSSYLCIDSVVSPVVLLKNNGNSPITSARIIVKVNNINVDTINWLNNLAKGEIKVVPFPPITLNEGLKSVSYHILDVNAVNDSNTFNNQISKSFLINKSPIYVNLKIKTDNYGDETSWEIKEQGTGIIVKKEGNYQQISGGKIYNYSICLFDSCFQYILKDSQGDGFNGAFGNGYALMTDANGDTLVFENNFTGSVKTIGFCVNDSSTSINERSLKVQNIDIYPNPILVGNKLDVKNGKDFNYQLYNYSGQLIWEKDYSELKNYNFSIPQGLYLIKVIQKDRKLSQVKKLIVH